MIIVSSLSGKHANKENQQAAIDSWNNYCECYSLNTKKEIEEIGSVYEGITFVETHRTVEALLKKPLVTINAIMDFAKDNNNDLLLINSDIIIDSLPPLKTDGITIFSRYDYIDHFGQGKIFIAGFDAFHIPKKFLGIFPPSIYALGAAWHDYWSVYRAILKGVPVYWPQSKHIYHKIHPTQYNMEEWIYISKYFQWEFNFPPHYNAGQMATHFLNLIKERSIKI